MINEEAINVLNEHLNHWERLLREKICPHKEGEETIEAFNMAIQALKNWEYLKEHITEMRDANGELNQEETCRFILNLMDVIENKGEEDEVN